MIRVCSRRGTALAISSRGYAALLVQSRIFPHVFLKRENRRAGQVVSDDFNVPAVSQNLLTSPFGLRQVYGWRGRRRAQVMDPVFDFRLAFSSGYRALVRKAAQMPVRHVHVATVDVPARRDGLERLLQALKDTRHTVTVSLAPLGNRGKFENINLALHDIRLDEVDWLIVIDDDVAIPGHFLDRFLCASEAASLRISQPAHRFRSYTTWEITQRLWNSLVHTTRFVECGPVTAFHRDIFPHILPFPETRFGWGIDVIWAEVARRENFHIGVVDATPIEHLRPVAHAYDVDAAISEARQLLERFGVRRSNRQILEITAVMTQL